MNITHEQLDRLGKLADTADNVLAASTLPLPASTHLEGLKGGLREIHREITELYDEIGAQDA